MSTEYRMGDHVSIVHPSHPAFGRAGILIGSAVDDGRKLLVCKLEDGNMALATPGMIIRMPNPDQVLDVDGNPVQVEVAKPVEGAAPAPAATTAVAPRAEVGEPPPLDTVKFVSIVVVAAALGFGTAWLISRSTRK